MARSPSSSQLPLCLSRYFDDFDHKSIYSHVSMADFLTPTAMRFSGSSRASCAVDQGRLPVNALLIRAWLASPWKPIGKADAGRARPRR